MHAIMLPEPENRSDDAYNINEKVSSNYLTTTTMYYYLKICCFLHYEYKLTINSRAPLQNFMHVSSLELFSLLSFASEKYTTLVY